MAYRNKIKKNKKYSNLWQKNEIRQLSFKYLLFNSVVSRDLKKILNFFYLNNFGKYFKTAIVNYCIISKNPRWVFKKIFYSRQEFKKAVTKGTFMGVKKACW